MGKRTIKGGITLEYLKRFPRTNTKTLADLMYRENPEVWISREAARSSIRYYRGANGQEHRERIKRSAESEHLREPVAPGNPFGDIPDPIEPGESEPVRLKAKKTLIIADAHIPYHDKGALMTALERGYNEGVDAVIINGDFADFFSISSWQTDPRKRNLAHELQAIKGTLRIIREGFPGKQIWYKIGNHEERWESYLFAKAPELLGIEEFELAKILGCKDFNIRMFGRKQHIRLGDLNVVHGHEFGQSAYSPVNAARGYHLRALASTIGGHFHHTSEHIWKDINGLIQGTWSLGCLCDLKPDYRPHNKWNHGFAIVSQEDDAFYGVRNYKIIGGRVI